MKTMSGKCLLIIMVFLMSNGLWAEENFTTSDPVIITSAGQSADVLMAKVLAKKAGLTFELDKTVTAEKLREYKSIIFVCGGSTKGLGAAKIDKEEELKRVEGLLTEAKKQKMDIIMMHIGGKSRRGSLSDFFNVPVAEAADILVIVNGGNDDGLFTKISNDKGITLELPEKIVSVTDVLKSVYSK